MSDSVLPQAAPAASIRPAYVIAAIAAFAAMFAAIWLQDI
jgi:hypothetical protein